MTNNFEYHKLPSGLRLILVPSTSTKTVTVLILVGTGSRYETKKINGISHFLEHMMFKGTQKRPGALDISRELDSIGAEYNAFTSHEYTGYYAKSSADKFGIILDVVSDIFLNSKLDENEIAKEKGVIVEEINMYKDTPMRYVGELFLELLYGDQPLGWPVIGKKEGVVKLKRDNFIDYFNTHYFAENTIVAVAGNIDTAKTKKMIIETFSSIRQHKKLKVKPVKEKQEKPAAKIFYKKTDQAHLHLGVRTFDMFDKRVPVMAVMSVILGGGMSSRLWIEFREKRGMAYYISASSETFLDAGFLAAHAGVDNSKLITAIDVILNEYKKLKEKKVGPTELQKAKDFIKGRVTIGLESSDDLASFYAEQELLKNEILTPEEKLKKIKAVTANQIQELAKEIFVPEKLNFALVGPYMEGDKTIYSSLKL